MILLLFKIFFVYLFLLYKKCICYAINKDIYSYMITIFIHDGYTIIYLLHLIYLFTMYDFFLPPPFFFYP